MNSIPFNRLLHIAFVCLCMLLSGFGKPGLALAADIGAFVQNKTQGAAILNEAMRAVPNQPGIAITPNAESRYMDGVNLIGSDFDAVWNISDPARCESACNSNSQCKSWTWVRPGALPAIQRPDLNGFCALKNATPPQTRDKCCMSGYAVPPNDGMTPTPGRPLPGTQCDQYAMEAVQQQQENLERQCGFQGPRWNSNPKDHYNWCIHGNNYRVADRESRFRQNELNQCRQTREVKPAPPPNGITTPPGPPPNRQCDQYARESVRQQRENLERQCGFRGSQWQADYKYHYSWCASGSNRRYISGEVRNRQAMLERCIRKVTVPNLIGLDMKRAKTVLDEHGLSPGSVSSEISEQKEGTVLSQRPQSGEKVKAGNSVDVIVADQMLLVPDLAGLSRNHAEETLIQHGLQAGEIREQFSLQEESSVIAQNPAAGTRVKPGTVVVLDLAAHSTLILISAGTLLGLLVAGGAYSFQSRRNPTRSASGSAAPVIRVSPHKDSGSSEVASGQMKKPDHEVQFNPVSDRGEQRVSTDADSTAQTGGKDE